ncbi:site-specific DNA-methyltransferase [Amycolatopsis sp. DSM 110486]|uniref:DNA-methyltransferase n=1 Tax=Amycolatopsis sp. DSM 110486 TaxID=2865832 RepID=UPI00210395EA|nr:site-specific DNA-methyltransferase [Amycolatopsis sp. DSM 110486]
MGLEPSADDYIENLRALFSAARRVLTARATVWINLGDSYSTNSDGYWCVAPGEFGQPRYRPRADVLHKNLLGMPWRPALAMQDDGWLLRSAIVWHKPHTTPTPIQDRLATRHEMVFLFVTQPDYFFDLDAIRQSHTDDHALRRRAHRGGTHNTAPRPWPWTPGYSQRCRNPGNVWTIPPDRTRAGHQAPSPSEIPGRCIAAGSPPGGHVFDPFSGGGTTGVTARALGRHYIGIDTNPAYHRIAMRRLGLDCDWLRGTSATAFGSSKQGSRRGALAGGVSLQERGWFLRSAVVWEKPNARPESVRDRLAQRYEMVFLLAQSGTHQFWSCGSAAEDGTDLWQVSAGRSRTGHPAAGTLEIARRCVRLGCPGGDVVLDPFCGSGTTGVAALEQGCSFVGIDLARPARRWHTADSLISGPPREARGIRGGCDDGGRRGCVARSSGLDDGGAGFADWADDGVRVGA